MATADRPAGAASLTAALVLHLAVFAVLMFTDKPRVIPIGAAVPITIVSEAPSASPPKAAAAPEVQSARSETPADESPPPEQAPMPPEAPPPPKPKPRPKPISALKPPAPALKPAPAPKPPPPTKAAARPTPPKKTVSKSSLDLDALQASLDTPTHAAPRPRAALRGPTRAQTAPVPGPAPGISTAEQAGLSQLLNRLWNPNCSVEGGDAVLISVTFTVGYDGHLIGRVSAGGRENSSDPVVQAAARRALDAVHAVEPYQPVYRGAPFRINFDAKKACANR